MSLQSTPQSLLPQVQEFSADGIWQRPADARVVQVVCLGGGGGGGGGKVGGAGTSGGGAGEGGHFVQAQMVADDLPPAMNIAVGGGGLGGASTLDGAAGGDSVFGAYLFPTLAVAGNDNLGTSINAVLPDGSDAEGKLLIVNVVISDTETMTWPSGWTSIDAGNTALAGARMETRYRVVDGTEGYGLIGAYITVSGAVSKYWRSIAWSISGAGIPQAAAATGSASAANAPNLAPSGGSLKYLWIVHAGWDGDPGAPTGYPYADNQNTTSAGSAYRSAMCSKLLEASSDNPAAFTVGNGDWRAITIAVPPSVVTEYLRVTGGSKGLSAGTGGSGGYASNVGWTSAIDGGHGGAGGAGASAAVAGTGTVYSAAGGGGGGGRDGGGTGQVGAAGGTSPSFNVVGGGGGGGAIASAGSPGAAGDSTRGGQGGGGGGGNAAGTGGAGGTGGDYGGGGGGGGAGSATGGRGGDGGIGRVWVYSW